VIALWVAAGAAQAAETPFQEKLTLSVPDGFTSACTTLYTVPADKRLVIEFASAFTSPSSGQTSRSLTLRTTVGGKWVNHHLPMPLQTANDYIAAQVVRLYADPNTLVTACGARNVGTGSMSVVIGISGLLVDVP
jgi:hypothetical protein